MRPPRTVAACLLAGLLFLAISLFLWLDNATVDVSSTDLGPHGPAGEVGCVFAPWDAGINGNHDGPGGEHSSAYYDEVRSECADANTTRFDAGIATGVLALILLGIGVSGRVPGRRHPTTE
jgi:hypothetical protein